MKRARIAMTIAVVLAVLTLAACGGSGSVSAAKWEEAFAESSFANYKMTATMRQGEYSSVMEMQVDGKKIKSTSDGTVTYLSEENGKFYYYRQENGVWTKTEAVSGTAMASFEFLKGEKDSFTLSNGYYVCKEAKFKEIVGKILGVSTVPDGVAGTVKLKLTDGKLAEIAIETTYNGETASQSMAFSDYGKVSVTLPEVGKPGEPENPEPEKPAAADWEAAFAESSFANYKMTATRQQGEYSSVMGIQVDGKKIKATSGGTATYLSEENGKFYNYRQKNGVWTKTEAVSGAVMAVMVSFDFLKDEKDSFTLSNGYYVCKEAKFKEIANKIIGFGSSSVPPVLPDGVAGTVKLKLTDGKLAEIAVEMTYNGETATQSMAFSDYGKVIVTLPEVGNPGGDPQEPTQADWETAFSESSFSSYRVEIAMQQGSESYTEVNLVDGYKREINASGKKSYVLQENGKNYSVQLQNGAWQKSEMMESGYVFSYAFLKSERESFVLSDGYFVCKEEKVRELFSRISGVDNNLPEGAVASIRLRLQNGKLVELIMTASYQGEDVMQSMIFSDYGKVIVTLPQIAE